MDRIAVLPDIRPTGYLAILKTGYRISGRISGGCQIPDIRPYSGYFRHMMNYTKILKSLRMRKKCFINIRFAGYPAGYLESIQLDTGYCTGYLVHPL